VATRRRIALLDRARSGLGVLRRSVVAFRRNQGLLLAGAVAYYTLISLVPLFVVLLVVLSNFMDEARLIAVVRENLDLVLPGQAEAVTAQVGAFLDDRPVVGVLGALSLLFFSGTAFAVLERAMSVIFFHRVEKAHRHALVTGILPYLFVMALGVGVLVVTLISGALDVDGADVVRVLGHEFSLAGISRAVLHGVGFVGLALLLTALYLVLPVGHLRLKHALTGGITATVLWEITRSILVWYLARLSMISVVYGSLATTVIVLLSLELAAIIVLFGAQVIAELERSPGGAFSTEKVPVQPDASYHPAHVELEPRSAGRRASDAGDHLLAHDVRSHRR
jgi:membrane protein